MSAGVKPVDAGNRGFHTVEQVVRYADQIKNCLSIPPLTPAEAGRLLGLPPEVAMAHVKVGLEILEDQRAKKLAEAENREAQKGPVLSFANLEISDGAVPIEKN